MSISDALNVDMKTVGRWLADGVSWWLDELWELIPSRWRTRIAPRWTTIAQVVDGGFQFWRIGEKTTQPAAWASTARIGPALILLPPEAILERDVDLPALSEKDTRRMIALEIDRLTPFEESEVYYDICHNKPAGEQRTSLAVLRRSYAADILASAEARQIEVTAISVGDCPNEAPPRYDFRPVILRARGTAGTSRAFWWTLAAALLALNLGLLVWRDAVATDALRAAVVSRQGMAELALRVRERANAEALRRNNFLARRRQSLPLPMIDALTKALPAPIWIQHLEWNGRSVRIAGFKDAKQDILQAIQASPYFEHARLDSVPTSDSVLHQRFELSADVRAPR